MERDAELTSSSAASRLQATLGPSFAIERQLDGGGWCWGRNFEGQVGAGEYETVATEPRQLRIR